MAHKIRVTPEFEAMFDEIRDRRIQNTITDDIDELAEFPDQQGKPLRDELTGCKSKRTAGQRYRIIFSIDENTKTVWILGIGIRKEGNRKKDIYSRMIKLSKGAKLLKRLKLGRKKGKRTK